jgi:hypothetical protein
MTDDELAQIEERMKDRFEHGDRLDAVNELAEDGLELVAEVRRLRDRLEVISGRDGFVTAEDAQVLAKLALQDDKAQLVTTQPGYSVKIRLKD